VNKYLLWALVGVMFGMVIQGFPTIQLPQFYAIILALITAGLGVYSGMWIVLKYGPSAVIEFAIVNRNELIIFFFCMLAGRIVRAYFPF
jgi:hypothetical protein